jgi:hypothetical protein
MTLYIESAKQPGGEEVEMPSSKRWEDLSSAQKRGIIILGTLQVLLAAVAFWDLSRRPADQIKGSKSLWIGLIMVNWVGPLAYFIVGRK